MAGDEKLAPFEHFQMEHAREYGRTYLKPCLAKGMTTLTVTFQGID